MFRAAKWMGVPPWVLAKMPTWWCDKALIIEAADIEARNAKADQQRKLDESRRLMGG